ncbi:OTU domain, ubiquitin aldehyde binding [Cichlidogyrus casuarinus]|uniref:ubiquitinyl hydrolase 1 n=1 Tax=Cichlidogyrus casuarinus TaxID=1844966 RepID=A0ABD2Q752_9PLAT
MDLEEQTKCQQTQRQVEELEQMAKLHPLVSELLETEQLLEDCGNAFMPKFKELAAKYKHFRRIRPDGSCFYRGFCYALVEHLVLNSLTEEAAKLKLRCQTAKEELVKLGYSSLTIEDFEETFTNVLDELVINGSGTAQDVYSKFNDEALSNYFVVFMRLMVSSYIQSHVEDYKGLITTSPKEWCQNEVEPVQREADSIHVSVIALATGFSILVENCQLSGDRLSNLVFPGSANETTPEAAISIKMLYKPGHYDLLY